ncbi:hypothetical protein NDU88_002679 [Pleurodeles waltl]|uniref:Reverse transcriptase domain-containing protein n=1 Tax=Pleurodeles waltl TaxID=8319 RepID=A0AAV7KW42_PLEWA|nr:hypothetical protein NDU88_002679 [Pleurodeles waltl]
MANIVVFLKKGKAPQSPASYRPITLMNSDAKVYSKIFAARLSLVIKKLVIPRQHGYVPGRDTVEHIQRVITLFDATEVAEEPMAVALLDAEKAFDRVSWKYLWQVMENYRFREKFILAIKAMHKSPGVRIQLMGGQSECIQVGRGSRQGCPCSPLLFVLYIDPLLRQLEGNRQIIPVCRYGWETKVLVYADDIAIITSNPDLALKEIEAVTTKFGMFSGYLLNRTKTQLLVNQYTNSQDNRRVEHAVYLGINISPRVGEIINLNLDPILAKARNDMHRWNNLHLTIMGRGNMVKMILLPKLLYLFRAIPLNFTNSRFEDMDRVVMRFIGAYGKCRRSGKFMSLPREKGGWALPNMKLYQMAAAFQYMRPLWGERSGENEVEDAPNIYELLVGSASNGCLLTFHEPGYYKKARYKVLEAAYKCWRPWRIKNRLGRFNYYTLINNNPSLPEIFKDNYMAKWASKGIVRLGDFFDDFGMKAFMSLL